MSRPSQLEQAITRFERDRISGASDLARDALRLLKQAGASGIHGARLDALRRRLMAAHPTMAAVWNAVHAADPQAFLRGLRNDRSLTARRARRLLPAGGVVLTISCSATVLDTLRSWEGRVIVAESLPGAEGKRTASLLARAGTHATVVPDATLGKWAAAADAALMGADAVTPRGVINKVGSRLLALAAKVERCPCYVAADSSKFSLPPSRFPLPLLGPESLFEFVELDLIERVVSEHGALTGRLVARRLAG